MIFLTVGTQLPFDRLVRAVDRWAGETGAAVFGQICEPGPEGYRPRHIEWKAFVTPDEFDARFEAAPFVVSHAGMGTIISAMTGGKPILVMHRKASLGEHRNNHQLASVAQLSDRPGISIAGDESEVGERLSALLASSTGPLPEDAEPDLFAQSSLIAAVRHHIAGQN